LKLEVKPLKFKTIQEEDLESLSLFLLSRGLKIDPNFLKELMSQRKFFGVVLLEGETLRGAFVTDPFSPPRRDELYGVKFLPPMVEKGFEGYKLIMVDLVAGMIPIGEVTVVLMEIDDLNLVSPLLQRGFELAGKMILQKVID